MFPAFTISDNTHRLPFFPITRLCTIFIEGSIAVGSKSSETELKDKVALNECAICTWYTSLNDRRFHVLEVIIFTNKIIIKKNIL